jgi:colanic acid biosynthesis glycosyl transferase WcaI
MGKRILLIGGNFYPELTGIGKYNGEMIATLSDMGYDCTVVTTFPYYPHWKIQEPYTKRSFWFKKEQKCLSAQAKDTTIFRCPHYIPDKPSGLKRMISDFSFTLSAFIKVTQLLFAKKFDFVLVVAPPFQLGLLGIYYKKLKGAKLLYHIQDLQIDAARDFNLIKSPFILNMLFKIERYILKKADVVSSISRGMIKKIEKKYQRPIVFFPNWVDTSLFFPITEKATLKQEFGFNTTDKVILYSGAIGEKQGLEAILDAAEQLKPHADFKFVICGTGPYKEKLLDIKNAKNLDNVIFLALQPYERLNMFLNMADVHLVLQRANAADLVMPSKLTAILSVGGLAIVTASEGAGLFDVIHLNKMGILVEPEQTPALVQSIMSSLDSSADYMKENARLYAEEYLSIDEIFRKYTVSLQQ